MNKITISMLVLVIAFAAFTFIYFNPKYYTGSDFDINVITSNVDKDNDGIDDLSDILLGARKYISTKPKYLSKYYSSGYPDDNYGVCTDVIAQGMLAAGYDLMELVNKDRIINPSLYRDEVIDKKIDFRRVRNLDVYLANNWTSLTLNINDISEWQPGDIITTKKHIALVSDKRNKQGIPFIIHHAFKGQLRYEEDALDTLDIIGHYRVIKP